MGRNSSLFYRLISRQNTQNITHKQNSNDNYNHNYNHSNSSSSSVTRARGSSRGSSRDRPENPYNSSSQPDDSRDRDRYVSRVSLNNNNNYNYDNNEKAGNEKNVRHISRKEQKEKRAYLDIDIMDTTLMQDNIHGERVTRVVRAIRAIRVNTYAYKCIIILFYIYPSNPNSYHNAL